MGRTKKAPPPRVNGPPRDAVPLDKIGKVLLKEMKRCEYIPSRLFKTEEFLPLVKRLLIKNGFSKEDLITRKALDALEGACQLYGKELLEYNHAILVLRNIL